MFCSNWFQSSRVRVRVRIRVRVRVRAGHRDAKDSFELGACNSFCPQLGLRLGQESRLCYVDKGHGYVMLCYVMLCYDMLCYDMLCYDHGWIRLGLGLCVLLGLGLGSGSKLGLGLGSVLCCNITKSLLAASSFRAKSDETAYARRPIVRFQLYPNATPCP